MPINKKGHLNLAGVGHLNFAATAACSLVASTVFTTIVGAVDLGAILLTLTLYFVIIYFLGYIEIYRSIYLIYKNKYNNFLF